MADEKKGGYPLFEDTSSDRKLEDSSSSQTPDNSDSFPLNPEVQNLTGRNTSSTKKENVVEKVVDTFTGEGHTGS